MSSYDVAFWALTGGVAGGVISYFMVEEVQAATKNTAAVVVLGALAGVGIGALAGSRFQIVGQAVDQIRRAL